MSKIQIIQNGLLWCFLAQICYYCLFLKIQQNPNTKNPSWNLQLLCLIVTDALDLTGRL